jgi:hypothetical protein
MTFMTKSFLKTFLKAPTLLPARCGPCPSIVAGHISACLARRLITYTRVVFCPFPFPFSFFLFRNSYYLHIYMPIARAHGFVVFLCILVLLVFLACWPLFILVCLEFYGLTIPFVFSSLIPESWSSMHPWLSVSFPSFSCRLNGEQFFAPGARPLTIDQSCL